MRHGYGIFCAFGISFLLSSVNLEEDSDEESPALTPELREALNLYLSRKLRLQFSSQKLGELDSQAETKRDADFFPLKKISPVVRDFLAMQRIKELFPEEHEFDHVRTVLFGVNCNQINFFKF